MQQIPSSNQFLIKQVTPIVGRNTTPLYRQNPTAQEQQKPLKDILFVLLVDCLIFLFLVTGILTITLYIIRFIAGV